MSHLVTGSRPGHPAQPVPPSAPPPLDAGVTLVELLVAVVVFGVLGGIVASAVLSLDRAAGRVEASSSTQAQVWSAYTALDQQVRYADAVNLPGTAGGSAWVELRTTTPADTSPRCYQWRYTPSTGALQVRSWGATADAVPAATWRTLVTTEPNANGTQPFTTLPATTTTPHQSLRIELDVTGAGGAAAVLATTFAARNSGPDSPGNADVAPHDGVSDHPVCSGHRS